MDGCTRASSFVSLSRAALLGVVGGGRAWSRAGRKKKKPEEGDSSSGLSEGVRLGEAAFSLLLQSKSRKVGDP